jgi:hypothetical protein
VVDTTPNNWFIPSLPFTQGNSVVALIDGSDFMKAQQEGTCDQT